MDKLLVLSTRVLATCTRAYGPRLYNANAFLNVMPVVLNSILWNGMKN